MNKVEKVSIGGFAFTLEEGAYASLGAFLSEWDRCCATQDDGQEILESVEERISEHLLDSCGKDKVLTPADIAKVTAEIGLPREIGRTDAEKKTAYRRQEETQRRFLRDPEHRLIGGVCSGLAAYFKVDVVLVRVVWVFLFILCAYLADTWKYFEGMMAFVALTYPVLWMVSPSPKTAKEQRLVHEAASAVSASDFWPVMGKVFRLLFGGIFAITGIVLLAAAITYCFLGRDIPMMAILFEEGSKAASLFALTIFLPAIGFLWEGIRMLFDMKPVRWHPGLICFLLWFASLIAFGVLYYAEFFL